MAESNLVDFLDAIEEFDEEIPDEVFVSGEYELEVRSIKFQTTEGDNPFPRFNITLLIVGDEEAEPVYHTLWLPTKDHDKRDKNRRQRAIRDFVRAFGYDWPMSPTELSDDNFKGRTTWATVGTTENKRSGEREHVIKSWIAPA